MNYSKWSVSSAGNFFHNDQAFVHRKVFILHLDDHKLFAKGLENCILPFFPLADIINIKDGHRALRFMKDIITDKSRIDLIITDINHPGLKGDEFLVQLRQFEYKMKVPRTPAIVLSFVDAANMPQLCRPGLNMVDRYFSKAAEMEDIVDALEDIMYPNE